MNEALKPVLVVGAGPTGMTAALELSRFGIPVRLVERSPEPATTSRAVGVQARTLELLEQRGLAEPLIKIGNKGLGGSIYGSGKRLFRLEFEQIDSKYNYLLLVSQAETERIFREALEKSGVRIERNVTMIAFAQEHSHSGVTAVLQHTDGTLERFECAYMVEAEGAHSTARETLGLHFEGKSLPEDYLLGDLYLDGNLVESDLHLFSSEHGFMGLFPLGGRHFRLIASNPIDKPVKGLDPTLDELQQIFDQRSHLPARLHDMSWSSWFRINSRMISSLKAGSIFLGGDSAHIHSPAGGQGMNTGIQDMLNLGWKMAFVMKGYAKPELLDTYSSDRLPVIRDVLSKSEGLTSAIDSENALLRSVFNHIAPWIVSTEIVQHKSTERISQLSLNYRKGPLSASDGHSGALKAGDRLPDLRVTVLEREGQSVQSRASASLFGLIDPSVFTLLFSNVEDDEKTYAELRETLRKWQYLLREHQIAAGEPHETRFKQLFGDGSSVVLVRPDGYLAFTGTENSIPVLANYCEKWLLPERSPAVANDANA